MSRVPLLLSLVALALSLFAVLRPASQPESIGVDHPTQHVEKEVEEVELAVHMGRIQRFHQKWWAAGKAGNAELAGFYLHELEEAMELIADAQVVEDGVDVSSQMRTYGTKTIESLEEKLKSEGVAAMHADAATLVNNCNSCHMACGYPFIRIQVPAGVNYPDQDFAPPGQ